MKKVLVIGASSFIGSSLCVYLRDFYRVYGTYNHRRPKIDGVPMLRMEISPTAPIESFLKTLDPDAVIYCAARIDNDACERDPLGTIFINAECPAWIGRWMSNRGGRFIFLSTSKVFSGRGGNYVESDPADPVGGYGSSKRQGEEWLSTIENTFILRLGTLYGIGSYGQTSAMFNRVLESIWSKSPVQYIDDEYRGFFCVDELAKAIGICLDAEVAKTYIYHLSTGEKHTYYSFAKTTARIFGLPSNHLLPISGEAFKSGAATLAGPRGNDLSLDGSLFKTTFSHPIPSLEMSLLRWKDKLRRGC